MDIVHQTHHDLNLALRLGQTLSEPPGHFVRLVDFFTPGEKTLLLERAYDFYKTIDASEYSLPQFVAFLLSGARRGLSAYVRISLADNMSAPSQINLRKLAVGERRIVESVCQGKHSTGLAYVLCNTLIGAPESLSSDVIDLVSRVFGKSIDRPALAAGITRCLSYNEQLVSIFQSEAKSLSDCAMLISDEEFEIHNPEIQWDFDEETKKVRSAEAQEYLEHRQKASPSYRESDYDEYRELGEYIQNIYDPQELSRLADQVKTAAGNKNLENIAQLQKQLKGKLDLADRFRLVETQYGLLVPISLRPKFQAGFLDLVKLAQKDRSHLLNLSPRMFEEFISNLFSELGFKVELTKPTRDGGADIICVQNQNGIPLRLAVEVKRYKQGNPVSVELLRSFVGANEQFKANKLIYVTTSSYTRPAIDYADRYVSHLLALKDYDQIREWCEQVGRETWSLFG